MKNDPANNRFFDDLVTVNTLSGFKQWFFYAGMMFGGEEKWWGRGGQRPEPHEGLDICYYTNELGKRCRLEYPTRIPAVDDGTVYAISEDDYLGKSIFVRHDYRDSNSLFLHSVYAHAIPSPGLCADQPVTRGEVIASMADIRDRGLAIPGHIHLSMVFLPEDYPTDRLKWQILGLSYEVRLVDPLGYLHCDYTVGTYHA